jgi:hypothetical protein
MMGKAKEKGEGKEKQENRRGEDAVGRGEKGEETWKEKEEKTTRK